MQLMGGTVGVRLRRKLMCAPKRGKAAHACDRAWTTRRTPFCRSHASPCFPAAGARRRAASPTRWATPTSTAPTARAARCAPRRSRRRACPTAQRAAPTSCPTASGASTALARPAPRIKVVRETEQTARRVHVAARRMQLRSGPAALLRAVVAGYSSSTRTYQHAPIPCPCTQCAATNRHGLLLCE